MGVVIAVRAQPRARRPGVQGIAVDAAGGHRLRIAVTAPPADGRATEAVRAALAKWLEVPASRVTVLVGAGAREKMLHVAGDPGALAARLRAFASNSEATAAA